MRFQLLGPFEVIASVSVSIPRRRERRLLAVLLLENGRTIPLDRLTELVWDDEPAASVRPALRTHVSRLRSVLDPDEVRIERQGTGYVLYTDPDRVDAFRFQTLVRQAHDLTGLDRVRVLRSALALWQGQVLADIATDPIRVQFGIKLEELRSEVLDMCVAAELAAGRHRELIAELRELVANYPSHERFIAQLMLALYRSDRQADALQVYAEGRRTLADEFGVDPGADLRQLHERILHADPALDLPDAVAAPTEIAIPHPVPAQLPADVMGFTGRTSYLDRLDALLAQSSTSTAVVISAIAGTGGVGKTALAVHWAHRIKTRFPDGQLYVNLRGYGPEEPAEPAEALAGFLRALGIDGRSIPEELADRAALFRTMMAGKRLLVILDNASSAQVVRPLLPGTPEALVVITSRDSLRGLAVRDGAHSIELAALSIDESRVLLENLVGERVRHARAAADALAARCAQLPLALRLVADLAGRRPDVELAQLVDELADEQNRLRLLSVGNDPHSSIDPVFSWSYNKLSAPAARLFRMLGLPPGDDVGPDAAAALLGISVEVVSGQLAELVDAHLLEQHRPGRFRPHDLLRAYARHKAEQEDTNDVRQTALEQLIEFYLNACARAMAEQDMAWLEAERPNLMAVAKYAADHDQRRQTYQLAGTFRTFLDLRGYNDDARTLHQLVLGVARSVGDQAAESRALGGLGLRHWRLGHYRRCEVYFDAARDAAVRAEALDEEADALNGLGVTLSRTGRYSQALPLHQRALTIGKSTGNGQAQAWGHTGIGYVLMRLGRPDEALAHFHQAQEIAEKATVYLDPEGFILSGIGMVYWRTGRYDDALTYHRRTLAVAQNSGSHYLEAQARNGLGYTYWRLGRYAAATSHHEQALALGASSGNRDLEGLALNGLGRTCARRGYPDDAVEYHQRALTLAQDNGDRDLESRALAGLGYACAELGRYTDALSFHERALALAHETGERSFEAEALNGLAAIVAQTGDPEQALEHLRYAVKVASEVGDAYELARSHHTIATIYDRRGRHDQAREHWRRARDGYTLLGVPEAALTRHRAGPHSLRP